MTAPLRYARREALFVMSLWVGALIYTVGYCYLRGYAKHEPLRLGGIPVADLSFLDRSGESLRLIFGAPDWVIWGVGLPWLVCTILTVWFSFWFMKDEDLGQDHEAELAERIRQEGPHG